MKVGGRFITLEGIDGAGKSTHLATIAASIEAREGEVLMTREPGGTPLGETLRGLILSEAMHLDTETLLMFASRNEHLQQVIRPALTAGRWVVSDRFTEATFAYQGGGRGADLARIEALAKWVHADFAPDLTFLFDLPPAIAARRLAGAPGERDRFEKESLAFFSRVRECYLDLAARHADRFVVVDATNEISDITKTVEDIIATIC